MSKLDVRQLAEWIGPEGAVAGIEKSNITNADLMILARENGLVVDKKTARKQLAIELVMSSQKRLDKPTELLLVMSADELQRYFTERFVSNAELLTILNELGIAPKGKQRGKLLEFAAHEISDLGMFQRVAKGNTDKRR